MNAEFDDYVETLKLIASCECQTTSVMRNCSCVVCLARKVLEKHQIGFTDFYKSKMKG